MGKPPELNLAGLNLNDGIDLAVDGDDLAPLDLDMLDKEKPFRQTLQDRKNLLQVIDNKSARHATQHLFQHEPWA